MEWTIDPIEEAIRTAMENAPNEETYLEIQEELHEHIAIRDFDNNDWQADA